MVKRDAEAALAPATATPAVRRLLLCATCAGNLDEVPSIDVNRSDWLCVKGTPVTTSEAEAAESANATEAGLVTAPETGFSQSKGFHHAATVTMTAPEAGIAVPSGRNTSG